MLAERGDSTIIGLVMPDGIRNRLESHALDTRAAATYI
jgi:hypothetical protein